jgi:hypothetical protein
MNLTRIAVTSASSVQILCLGHVTLGSDRPKIVPLATCNGTLVDNECAEWANFLSMKQLPIFLLYLGFDRLSLGSRLTLFT